MATQKKLNVQTATDAMEAEVQGGHQALESAELVRYVAELDRLAALVKEVKGLYKKELAVLASQKSREARKERVARALALLEAQEAEQAK